MGGGSWSASTYATYSKSLCRDVALDGTISNSYSAQEMFKARNLDPALNCYGVTRECVDSQEHPNTIPVILALDVTGSMGKTSVEIASKLNKIMTSLYDEVKDVEFMIMGIGDFSYDEYPLQVSQFESDIRIAEQLDKIYFESGGGGNAYESYSAAWYFAANHTELDCWKRNKKGLIITIGDELLNPYLPLDKVSEVIGDDNQADIETNDIYEMVKDKYDLYHINVTSTSSGSRGKTKNVNSFAKLIGSQNVCNCNTEEISEHIINIVKDFAKNSEETETSVFNTGTISW